MAKTHTRTQEARIGSTITRTNYLSDSTRWASSLQVYDPAMMPLRG
jgi:hypothetical protein